MSREVHVLVTTGSSELREKFPSVGKLTEDGQGTDLVVYPRQAEFATEWLKYCSQADLDWVNKAISYWSNEGRFKNMLDSRAFILLEFFNHSKKLEESGHILTPYSGGKIVNANICLRGTIDDYLKSNIDCYLDAVSVPLLITFNQQC